MRWGVSVKTFVVPVLFFAALCAPGFGYTVLWDTSHGVAGTDINNEGGYQPGPDGSYYYYKLADHLKDDFTINTTSLGFNDTNLAATDIAVVCVTSAFSSTYSDDEVDALATFVGNGGGLLIMGGHPFLPNGNIQPVATEFDIIFPQNGNGDTYTYSGTTTMEALEHPVFAGFTATDSVSMYLAGEITIEGNAFALAQDPTTEEILIAGANYGDGRVIALGDYNMFAISPLADTFDQEKNRDFAVNTFEWLAVPEPATILLMATGFAFLRRRR